MSITRSVLDLSPIIEGGDARLALEAFRGSVALEGSALERARVAMEQPQPRVALGLALRGVATSAIDVSDGLLGDLGHVLRRSGVGAELQADALPRSDALPGRGGAVYCSDEHRQRSEG